MTYSTSAITTLSEAITALITFAGTAGWTVGGTGSVPTFIPPSGGSPIQFERNNVAPFDGIDITIPALSANKARLNSPYINGAGATPVVPAPSAIHLHSGVEDGVEFISGVIVFSTVGYRHFYMGGLVPVGTYTGNQAIAANWHYTDNQSFNFPFDPQEENKFLFGGLNQPLDEADSGYVYLVAGAASSIRPNKAGASGISAAELTLGENKLIGGATDGPNDALVTWGQAHYASATLLVPINLYVTEGSPARLRPVGHVAGVRMVNMTNYDEAQQILLGDDAWRVYPEFKKTPTALVARGTSYGASESSYFWGLAYPEGV